MSPLFYASLVLACLSMGMLLGMYLGKRLPQHHLNHESRDAVKLGIGLVATMTALVLGLVTASAKGFFDGQETSVKQCAAEILSLDRFLARYGPETQGIRESIARVIAMRLNDTWPEDSGPARHVDKFARTPEVESIETRIRELAPQNEEQRWLKERALETSASVMKARWLMLGSEGNEVPRPFLMILSFWLMLIFLSFGLLAPRNPTVIIVLLICALSVSAGVFLIMEMGLPYEGLIKVPSTSLRYTFEHLGK